MMEQQNLFSSSEFYILRRYQEEAVDAAVDFFKGNSKHNALMVLPTGSGKSLIIAATVSKLGEPTLIFQPTKEILEQNYSKMCSYGYSPGIYSASKGRKEIRPVTFATIGSVKNKAEIFKHFRNVVIDEVHAVNPKSGMYKSFLDQLNSSKILGMSVAPNSYIELKGGPFRNGFVGDIEDAFNIAVDAGLKISHINSFEVIEFNYVFSRGWCQHGFGWKKCKSIIRHITCMPMLELRAHGNSICVTEDHSVYSAVPGKTASIIQGKSKQRKKYPKIVCPHSKDIREKDVLMGDDGNDWDKGKTNELEYNMVEFVKQNMPKSRVRIYCDVASIPIEDLILYCDRKTIWRWKKINSLPLKVYLSLEGVSLKVDALGVEGSKVRVKHKILLSDYAYILGFYLGNGWLSSCNPGRMGFSVKKALFKKVYNKLIYMKGIKWNVKVKPDRGTGATEISVNNIFVYNLIKNVCGIKRSYEKTIPGEWIISWPKEARENLLDGLSDSDGHLSKRTRNRERKHYTTTSSNLANSILSLLRSLGIIGSRHERLNTSGGVINGRKINGKRKAYVIHWSFHSECENNNGHCGVREKFIHDTDSFFELKVNTNKPILYSGFVYDLEMDGHPSFVSSGILVHNTATPYRLNTDGFGGSMLKFLTRTRPRVFRDLIYYVQNKELFDAGYLSPIRYTSSNGVFDRSQLSLNTTGADFTDRSVKRYYARSGFPDKVAMVTAEELKFRRNTLVFTRFVAEAQQVVDQVRGAEIVTGETKKNERERLLKAFKNNDVRAIVNVGVLTTGFDYPELETIIIARPTLSLALYYQMIGRGIRPYPGKEFTKVIDMCGNMGLFGKIEDLKIVDGGNGKWFIAGGNGKQLTNVYYGQKPKRWGRR